MPLVDRLREIFPSKWHFVFFLFYMLIYIFNSILIRYSKRVDKNAYDYDTTSVVLSTEITKLALAISIYRWQGNTFTQLAEQLYKYRSLVLFYLLPAGLYCVYNNLIYVNLSYYDPTTYYILLQLRVAVTGIIYQVIFRRTLSRLQWFSLLLLTIGCIIKQLGAVNFATYGGNLLNGYLLLIAIQIACSCLAGVYNEYLLKGDVGAHLMVQNIFMYFDSIACNLLAVSYKPNSQNSIADLHTFGNALVLLIILMNAFCGLSTSYFIKTFNSIMKAYTTGIELALTAVICFFIFATPLDGFTLISIVIVSYASYIFVQNPVISRPTTSV